MRSLRVLSLISIPYGSIKRRDGQLPTMPAMNFNSLWFD